MFRRSLEGHPTSLGDYVLIPRRRSVHILDAPCFNGAAQPRTLSLTYQVFTTLLGYGRHLVSS